MKILYSIIFLFFSVLGYSQDKKAYLLLDKNEELIIYDGYDYFIFNNKKDLEEYNYYKNNKFPVKDSITEELDLSKMGKVEPYLQVSKFRSEDIYYINEDEYRKLKVLNREEFISNFAQLRKNEYDLFFIEKINNDCYKITPMYIYVQM